MTDSDLGAIIVLDLASGKARRILDTHYSAKAEPGVPMIFDGVPLKFSPVHATESPSIQNLSTFIGRL